MLRLMVFVLRSRRGIIMKNYGMYLMIISVLLFLLIIPFHKDDEKGKEDSEKSNPDYYYFIIIESDCTINEDMEVEI